MDLQKCSLQWTPPNSTVALRRMHSMSTPNADTWSAAHLTACLLVMHDGVASWARCVVWFSVCASMHRASVRPGSLSLGFLRGRLGLPWGTGDFCGGELALLPVCVVVCGGTCPSSFILVTSRSGWRRALAAHDPWRCSCGGVLLTVWPMQPHAWALCHRSNQSEPLQRNMHAVRWLHVPSCTLHAAWRPSGPPHTPTATPVATTAAGTLVGLPGRPAAGARTCMRTPIDS